MRHMLSADYDVRSALGAGIPLLCAGARFCARVVLGRSPACYSRVPAQVGRSGELPP